MKKVMIEEKPQITVITVTLNAGGHILRCLESVKEQVDVCYEHIIFDGGSTDETIPIIEEFNNNVKLIQGQDSGIYDALNQAIQFSNTDYISILHSDDFYSCPLTLNKVCSTFLEQPNCDIIYGRTKIIDKDTFKIKRLTPVPKTYILKLFFYLGGQLSHPSMFVRRHVYDVVQFHPKFRISSDYLFQLRCFFDHGFDFIANPDIIIYQCSGGTSQADYSAFVTGKKESYKILTEFCNFSFGHAIVATINNILIKVYFRILSILGDNG